MEKPEVGDIKIFTLTTLLELIGKVSAVHDDRYELSQAYAIQLSQQMDGEGRPMISAAMSPLSMFIEKDEKSGGSDVVLYFNNILRPSDPPEDMVNQYSTITGSIIAPPSHRIQTPR
jgi:hypothetical protein